MDINISDLETQDVAIHKPKKTDDSLLGNITYQEKELVIYLNNVHINDHKKIKHKDSYYSVLILKANKRICKKLLEFDQQCIAHVKKNVGGWFTKLLDENVIEEYYTSSVSLDNNGFVIKIKLQSSDTILPKGKYDLKLLAKGLRFYKQRFIVEWDIVEYKHLDIDFINAFEEECSETWGDDNSVDDIEEVLPSQQDLEEIYETIFNQLVRNKAEKEATYHSSKDALDNINSLISALENNRYNIQELEKINEMLQNMTSE